MPFLPSLPDPAHLADLFARYPGNVQPLLDFHDGLLRGEGALSVGARELIAAYVSALNACRFCTGAHKVYAEVFGQDPDLIDALVEDPTSAPVDDRCARFWPMSPSSTTCPAGWSRLMRRPSMMRAGTSARSMRRRRSARCST